MTGQEIDTGEVDRFVSSVDGFLALADRAELSRYVKDHPALLTDAADAYLAQLVSIAGDRGESKALSMLEEYRTLLRTWREESVEDGPAKLTDNERHSLVQVRTAMVSARRAEGRFEKGGERAALDHAIASWRDAVNACEMAQPPFPAPAVAGALNGLAASLLRRYWLTHSQTDLNDAVASFERTLEILPRHAGERSMVLGNLGSALFERYRRRGDVADLEQALATYERASVDLEERSPAAPGILHNLGLTLMERFANRGRIEDLDRGIRMYMRAAELAGTDSPVRGLTLTNLGNALTERYTVTGDPADLDSAARLLTDALGSFAPESPEVAGLLGGLANVAFLRYQEAGLAQDLDRAIDTYREAVGRSELGSRAGVVNLGNLASSLKTRYAQHPQPQDLGEAVEAYRRSCAEAAEVDDRLAVSLARAWGDWAWDRAAWDEAADAYSAALSATERLVYAQYSVEDEQMWLGVSEGLPQRTAYALLMTGATEDAVVALERGRASVVTRALPSASDEEALIQSGRKDLLDRLAAVIAEKDREDGAGPVGNVHSHPTARPRPPSAAGRKRELEAVIDEIRQLPGLERFRAAPTADDIFAAAASCPLVYLFATDSAGVAVIVEGDKRSVTQVQLPLLDNVALRAQVHQFLSIGATTNSPDVTSVLDGICRWLWHAVMESLLVELTGRSQVVLIPMGLLGVLPLHAAWVEDASTATGRRYALDDTLLTYAVTARGLEVATGIADRIIADGLLAVSGPGPITQPALEHAAKEAEAAISFFPRSHHLRGRDATRAAVLDQLTRFPVAHFACLGVGDYHQPLMSGLVMADDCMLTVDDFMHLRLNATRLAVLSASKTALPGLDLPDEAIGLPLGLLQAGAGGVISTMFSISDVDAMILMTRFYEEWREEGMHPAQALRAAQQWVRDSTNAAIHERFPTETAMSGANLPSNARRFWEAARSHSHPYHWAAFAYFGA